MIQLKSGIALDVSRGPNWLFFRLEPSAQDSASGTLASDLLEEVSKHFIYRVVIEFSETYKELSTELLEQLDLFRKQLEAHDGALRVCGLNDTCRERLAKHCAESRTKSRIHSHSSVVHAVFGTEQNSSQPTDSESSETTQDSVSEALRVQ